MVAVPVELALLIGAELAAEVVLALVGVLEIVLAVRRGLPDVEDSALNGGTSFHICEHAVHVCDFAVGVGVLDDAVAEVAEGSVGRPEGAEDDVGGRRKALFGDDAVCDFVNETRRGQFFFFVLIFHSKGDLRFQTDHVADTVALVADGGADLANGVDELDTHHPLGGGQLDLASKVVDVFDQRAQDHASAWVGVGAHGVDDIGGEVGVEAGVGRHFGQWRGNADGWEEGIDNEGDDEPYIE